VIEIFMKSLIALAVLSLSLVCSHSFANSSSTENRSYKPVSEEDSASIITAVGLAISSSDKWNCVNSQGEKYIWTGYEVFRFMDDCCDAVAKRPKSQPVLKMYPSKATDEHSCILVSTDESQKKIIGLEFFTHRLELAKSVNIGTLTQPQLIYKNQGQAVWFANCTPANSSTVSTVTTK
jgi:hypothetical protein